jgi:16S rRNA (cytosine967-C5)-methyltransferase
MSRKIILELLLKMDKGGYSPIILDNALKSGAGDKAFITAVFYGVLERRLTLDYVIARFAKGNPDAIVRNLLRMSLYELMFMNSEQYAVVNETVEIAPNRAKSYVNAVLRNKLREKSDFLLEADADLSVKYSCPQWLVEKWLREYGEEYTLQILRTSVGKPPMFEQDGYVQDKSSYDACVGLNPQPGEVVLDLCAAPGGKSLTIARLMNNTGRVISCDINAKKLNLLAKSAKKLGLSIIETLVNDAKAVNTELPQADKVVCDVPCSGLGVIRRKPEIKYKPASDFEGLPAIQLAILRTGSRYVKVGGVLMYSTCTLSRAENDEVVKAFLNLECGQHGYKMFDLIEKRTTIPTEDGGDGFFVAYFRRTSDGEIPHAEVSG